LSALKNLKVSISFWSQFSGRVEFDSYTDPAVKKCGKSGAIDVR
jgi:hypothetical protein